MRWLLVVACVALAFGCGGRSGDSQPPPQPQQNKCSLACVKLKDCGVKINIACEGECASPADECAADCILEHTCDQIVNSNPGYAACVLDCLYW